MEKGYKLCEFYRDLTPLQEKFIILANNYSIELQKKEIEKLSNDGTDTVDDLQDALRKKYGDVLEVEE